MVGGVSIIKVGSIIESELKEKIARVDDSVSAVRSAKEEGVLAGGGVALLDASKLNIGDICKEVCKTPVSQLLKNAGVEVFEDIVGDYPSGYDVKKYEKTNMFDAGIVDSTKAIKHALINAVSASNTMLMTDAVLTNKRMI